MRKANTILAVTALGLLAASIAAYLYTESRGERFERGRKLLANLNPEEVAAVRLQDGEAELHLERRGETFRIVEKDGYAAKNEAVNRLLKTLLDVSLEKEVGSGPKLAEKLGLDAPGSDGSSADTTDVVLEDGGGKPMVHLRFGGELEGGGVYVQRLDGEDDTIYLTTSRPFLDTAPEEYLKKEILDVAAADIARIEGPDFVVREVFEEAPAEEDTAEEVTMESSLEAGVRESAPDGDPETVTEDPAPPEPVSLGLQLADLPAGKSENAAAMTKLKGVLTRLELEEVYPADSPEVAGLAFAQRLRIHLDDTSGYVLSLAEQGDEHYLRIEGFSTVGQVEITRDESEEELKAKAETLSRSDEIADFNAFHGSWVYKISDAVAEKLKLTKADLVE